MSYQSKSNDSFESRLRIYIFDIVINDIPFNFETFLAYDLKQKKEIIKQFTAEYYQLEREHEINGKSLDEIYAEMKQFRNDNSSIISGWKETYFEKVFKGFLSETEYLVLVEAQQCAYCNITKDQINELVSAKQLFKKNERGWNMEIDRMDPNQEYRAENCVPACYWCNNAKTDEFNAEEFKPIGELIGQTLRARLKDKNDT